MFADYHVHTEFSDDSTYRMEQAVMDAVAMGMEELCFTDHVDYGIKKDRDEPGDLLRRHGGPGEPEWTELANVDYPRYYEQFRVLQARYEGRIRLRFGLEFGMQAHTIDRYEKLFARYPFDFIILSVHEVEDKEFWNQAFQAGRTQQEYNERYYREMLILVQNYHHYSVLGHMNLITRYDRAGIYPFEKVQPLIREILAAVIADGKGIEVNTSCFRYGTEHWLYFREILKLYRELGGRILTIGSDSHKPEHLGFRIDKAKVELRDLGFREFCTFEGMEPTFCEL